MAFDFASTGDSRENVRILGWIGIAASIIVCVRWIFLSLAAYAHYRDKKRGPTTGTAKKGMCARPFVCLLEALEPTSPRLERSVCLSALWYLTHAFFWMAEYYCVLFLVAIGIGVYQDLFVMDKVRASDVTTLRMDENDVIASAWIYAFIAVTLAVCMRLRAFDTVGDEFLHWYKGEEEQSLTDQGAGTQSAVPRVGKRSVGLAHIVYLGGIYDNIHLFRTLFGPRTWSFASAFAVVSVGGGQVSSNVARFFAALFGGGVGIGFGIVFLNYVLYKIGGCMSPTREKNTDADVGVVVMLRNITISGAAFMAVTVIYMSSLMIKDEEWSSITSMGKGDRTSMWGICMGLGVGFVLAIHVIVLALEAAECKSRAGSTKRSSGPRTQRK
jgi:hypothetical protein